VTNIAVVESTGATAVSRYTHAMENVLVIRICGLIVSSFISYLLS